MSDGIVFNHPQLTVIVMAVLVQKLGGKATITQDDIDQIAFARLIEDWMNDGSIELRLERTHASRQSMKERPILFSAPMVRALLAGTKTQTRRVVKPQFAADALPVEMPATDPGGGWVVPGHSGAWWCEAAANPDDVRRCPYGQPGDRLWVRETWYCDDYRVQSGPYLKPDDLDPSTMVYRASSGDRPYEAEQPVWRPAIHMPRWASRITLEVTGVRVERLQDISEADAIAEGIDPWDAPNRDEWTNYLDPAGLPLTSQASYRSLWERINGPGSWDANPWVWVVAFRRLP